MDDSGFTALNFLFRFSSATAHLIKVVADRDEPCPYNEWNTFQKSLFQDRTQYGRGLSPSGNAHLIKALADRDEPCTDREWHIFHKSLLQDRTQYGRGLPPSEKAHLVKAIADRELHELLRVKRHREPLLRSDLAGYSLSGVCHMFYLPILLR